MAQAEPLLRLWLFGQMRAEDAAGRNVLPRSRKTMALLAVLALGAPRPILRNRLTALLWSRRARQQGRASLRQSVHELQRCLGPSAGSLLRAERDHVAMSEDGLWADARQLTMLTVSHSAALELFHGELLDGLEGLDPALDDWLTSERQRLMLGARSRAESMLTVAPDASMRIAAAERLLLIDRAHENAWRLLIDGYLEQEDRATAHLLFERYTTSLLSAGLTPIPDIGALTGRTAPLKSATGKDSKPAMANEEVRLVVLPARAVNGGTMNSALPGLAEEITAAVSRFRWISCIVGGLSTPLEQMRLTAATWGDLRPDYLLDTTVQRSGQRIRVIVHLVDVHAGDRVVWAHRFECDLVDVLTLQNDIAAETAARIDPELLIREGERVHSSELSEPTAHQLTLRAIPAIYRLEPTGFHNAGNLLEAAITMEPTNAAAHAWWSYWHLFLVGQAWAKDPVAATARAGELAERAVTLDPNDARALTLIGHVRGFLHKRAKEAQALHEKALSLNPNLPLAWCLSGLTQSYLGCHGKAIEQINRAKQLSPHDPHAFFFDMALMMPHFLRQDFQSAASFGRRAVELNPGFSSTYKGYLAVLGWLGQQDEAGRVRERLLGLEPEFSVREAVARSPMVLADDIALYADGLRRAGLRED